MPAGSNYVDYNDPGIPLEGDFGIEAYVSWLNAPDTAAAATSLKRFGFVAGHGHVWTQTTSSHLLLEAVMAFSGAAGAQQWLRESEALDKTDALYAHAIAVSGLGSYYAWHGANPTGPEYADYVGFVKGNDFFMVISDSEADDLGDTAPAQSKHQYDAAPPYTIPPSQWPENRSSLTGVLARLVPGAIVLEAAVLLAVVIATAAVLVARRRPTG